VGDGDSTVKVVDIAQQKIVDTVSTGGQARADEMAYDPDHEILIAINNADSPPFGTLISTKAGHRVLARVLFPDATDGAEQPVYFTGNKLFYVSIPEIGGVKAKGGVAVIDPLSGELVKLIPVEGRHPSGLAVGPADHLLLGCTAGARTSGLPPESVVISANTGSVLEVIRGLGGTDMVAYSHKANQYYTASSGMPNGPVLGVIDAGSSTAVQVIPLPGDSPHSVAVSEDTGQVFVPLGVQGGGCGGCVAVFAPQ
jgi:DNA-binding beta-propeller fold protein YncE